MGNRSNLILSLLILVSTALGACAQSTPSPTQPAPTPTTVVVQPAIAVPTTSAPTATVLPSAAPITFKPKDPTTYVVPNNLPEMLDPAFCYDLLCGEIIQNIYDKLIFYDREDPNTLIPMLALEVPSLENSGISADGLTYTFKIRPGVLFHDGSEMTPTDVAYTFQRGLLQGGTWSPQILFTEPILGAGIVDITDLITPSLAGPEITTLYDDPANLALVDPAVLEAACQQVTQAIVADDQAGTVTMKLAQPWGPFLTTLPGSWGAITSKSGSSPRAAGTATAGPGRTTMAGLPSSSSSKAWAAPQTAPVLISWITGPLAMSWCWWPMRTIGSSSRCGREARAARRKSRKSSMRLEGCLK